MVKTFKNLLLQNRGHLGAESLLKSSGTGGLPKLLNNGCTSLLPYAFVWEKTCKNLSLQNRGCLMAESLHILLGTSACLQWLCHSGERNVARGPLVYINPLKIFLSETRRPWPLIFGYIASSSSHAYSTIRHHAIMLLFNIPQPVI